MSQQADSSDIISTTTTCAKKQHPRKKFKAILETDRAHQQQQTQGANPARPPTTLDLINQFFIRKTTNYMTQTNKQYSFKMRPHKHQPINSYKSLTFAAALLFASTSLLLALTLAGADQQADASQNNYAQQQPIDGYGAAEGSHSGGGHGQANYGGEQHQQQHQPTKAKKIQIVYIKVPLAKLKPSLAGADLYGANNQSASGYGAKGDSTETKSHGSQSDQEHNDQQLSSQHSSFLIPMAVVQTTSSQQSTDDQPVDTVSGRGSASSHHALHSQPEANQEQLFNFRPTNGQQFGQQQSRRTRQHQSPMQLYQASQQMQLMSSPSVNHGINHGFMSSFLLGEKEKMTAAAMRMQPPAEQPNQAASASSNQAAAASNQTVAPAPTTNQNSNQQQQQQPPKQGPGGLMPFMMMPFSHMPDNAIGQAYNAAVGQALPVESGSPSSMLGSPSMQHTDNNNSKRGASQYGGGSAGMSGEPGSSPGMSPSGSYSGAGPAHLDMHSLEKGLQQSGSAYANSGPSSGYGNGINSFGASVAFSDYPTGSGQQTYGPLQASSSSNSNSNHQSSHSGPGQQQQQHQAMDSQYDSQKLRQAKKTIIPIVVQVEHAILENNSLNGAGQYNNQMRGNKYAGARGQRQMGRGKGGRGNKQQEYRQQGNQQQQQQQVPYGANSNNNEINLGGPNLDALGAASGAAQYINAANAQDINQITAQINAENAASAAAALAQADMAFGNGQAYMGAGNQQGGRYNQNGNQRPHQSAQSQYAAGLQSAASALLANTHPVIQAAASGGLASVSKLGAKLGEIIALPSMQVPNSIASLPSALSSITNQMAVQMNQAVQQVAKEHPTAHAFARQVAQHAGINLPNFVGQNMQQQQQHSIGQQQHSGQQQVSAAASDQHNSIVSAMASALPGASAQQLQNLKLSIGQNLQTAASQLMGINQKANPASTAASLLANPLAALYPPAMNAALKQLSSGLVGQNTVGFAPSSMHQQQQLNNIDMHQSNHFQQNQGSQQQQPLAAASSESLSAMQPLVSTSETSSPTATSTKPGKSSLKSKFLSFFQPPKFISNLLSWNDRADARNDQGAIVDKAASGADAIKASVPVSSNGTMASSEPMTTKQVVASTQASTATVQASSTPSSTTAMEPMKVRANEQQQQQANKTAPAA